MNAYLAIALVVVMGALTPNSVYNTSDYVVDPRDVLTIGHASDHHYGPPGTQNRDEAPVGSGATDPDTRLRDAMRSVAGTKHPRDGSIIRPFDYTIHTGDLVHEGTESVARILADHPDGLFIDGNHDGQDVRRMIKERHGSLTWGRKLGRVWFQALTECYTAPSVTTPPSVTQIGTVAGKLAARPTTEPIVWLVHRSVNGGYAGEWDAAALDALEALANSRNTLFILNGHDHEATDTTWRGIKVYSPGSVTQAPLVPPYSFHYPEAFNVIRIGNGWYDVANYNFGYDTTRVWAPGTWNYVTGKVAFTI